MKEIDKNDFYNLKFKGDLTERNEKNYISHFKTWIKIFFTGQEFDENLNWFCINQNYVLLPLMQQRNGRKSSTETLRKDINLLLHFLKIAEAGDEIINKYKVLNMALSMTHNIKESNNILDENEEKKIY